MSQPSIKKNFAYKSILTISTYIMGFITFPYISRVFGVNRLGLINFVDNTINYFLLFATMGINILGVREIATAKTNNEERNKIFSNILGINIWFTIATLVIYVTLITIIPKLSQYSELFYIGSVKIIFTTFLIEWFFTGIENFKYITIRSIIIKFIYIISVFLFIRHKDDYILYIILTVGTVVVNAIINMLYVKRYVTIIPKELLNTRYIKNNLSLGVYAIMTSMYLTFNVMYLGFVSDNTQVGYYTTAFKLYSVILGFFTAFTNVMLPRMSSLLAEGNNERFQELINKSFAAVAKFSIPLILCSMVLSPQIIYVLSGPGYEGAIQPMRIIMPAIIFVGIAQILAIQILMPMKKDKILLIASICGAIVSIIFNIILVPNLESIGSAIILLSCELLVTLIYIIYIVTKTVIKIPWLKILHEIAFTIPCIFVCILCTISFDNPYISLVISTILSISIWLICNILSKIAKKKLNYLR